GFAEEKWRGCTRSASKFPLGFSRQTIGFLIFFPQLLDELLTVLPRNLFHWQVLFAFETAGILAHDLLPFFLGHSVHAHVESLAQCDLVLGFVVNPFRFTLGTAHHEVPWSNPNEFH